MVNIFFISNNAELISKVKTVLEQSKSKLILKNNTVDIETEFLGQSVDLLIIDTCLADVNILNFVRKIKSNHSTQNTQVILFVNPDFNNQDLMKFASVFLPYNFSNEIFVATINSTTRTKNSFDIMTRNNAELAKSLYQLDVLYKTSTQLAGSLDKENLILSMIEGVEKTLSYDVSYTMIFRDKNDIEIIINSIYPMTKALEEAIKLRAVFNYKELYKQDKKPFILPLSEFKTKKTIKQQLHQDYDLKIFRYDSLLTEIKNGDKFVGLMEVFRKKEFSKDDAICFQTLSKQVAIPLESASLYETLKETNIKLEKLERLKSEFISIVSHELRTPLTALKNSLDIILTGRTGDITNDMKKFLDMAKRNSERLSGIINDLLDLSKVEAGKMEFKYAKHNINTSIEYVINALDNFEKEKELVISTNLDSSINDLYIDAQRIEQVLTNLLSNAKKFTPEHGKIEISTQIISEEELKSKQLIDQNKKIIKGDYAQISVKDTGIGIEKEDIVRVFDKFQQIENSLTRKVGGSGLGIPIAKQLVEAHRGFIWLESEINKGTIFSIAIPLLTDENVFYLDFADAISKAKTTHSSIGFIEIEEKNNYNNVIDKILLNEIDIIKKTDATKELNISANGHNTYKVFIPEADEFLLNFIYKKMSTYLQGLGDKDGIKHIRYSHVLYPQDGLNVEELQSKAHKKLACIK